MFFLSGFVIQDDLSQLSYVFFFLLLLFFLSSFVFAHKSFYSYAISATAWTDTCEQPIDLERLFCMIIFIQFCRRLIQQKQFTVILITGSVLLVNKISFYLLRISCAQESPGVDWFWSVCTQVIVFCFISFEFCASHHSLPDCCEAL